MFARFEMSFCPPQKTKKNRYFFADLSDGMAQASKYAAGKKRLQVCKKNH